MVSKFQHAQARENIFILCMDYTETILSVQIKVLPQDNFKVYQAFLGNHWPYQPQIFRTYSCYYGPPGPLGWNNLEYFLSNLSFP